MAKRPTVATVTSGYYGTTVLNSNFSAIEEQFDNTLSRDGSTPNSMAADIDMDSNDILNVADLTAVNVTVTGTLTGDFDASTILNGTVAPTTEGSDGDFYIDTVTTTFYGPKATTWPAGVSLVGSGLANVVDDTTPQLGGTLDANSNTIDMGTNVITDAKVGQWDTAYGWGDHAGVYQPLAAVLTNTTASYTTAEETKLAGIETAADVTDVTNVTAAGALMDSEVDADIKTLVLPANTTISAFGATLVDDANAAAALTTLGAQPLATVLTNTTASFLLADETKLDGIEALADVTDAANVVAALDGATLDTATIAATDLVITKDVGTGNLQTVTAQSIADLGSGGANLGYTAAPTNGTVTSDSGTDATLTVADATNAGLMVPEYFTRLASVEAAADVTDTTNVTAAGALMDSEVDANIKTLVLPASTTISAFGATVIDDANQAAAQATLGVDPAGTDNSTDVTLAGTPNYITLAGQVLTRGLVDLTTDVTGDLPVAEGGTGSSTAAGARTNLGLAIGTDVQAYSAVLAATTASFLTADETKLDGIEALADVTDVTNVTAAGALMDSEVDANLKTFVLPASTTISAFGATVVDDANAAAAATTLGLGTGDSPQFTAVNIGHATDTTLARVSAGVASIEGDTIALLTATQTLTNKTHTDIILDGSVTEQVYAWTETTGAVTGELEPAEGTVQTVTLTGNITSLTDNVAAGESITLGIDDGTAYTITWPTITWVNNAGAAPTLATSGYTWVAIWKVSTTLYGALVGDGT